MSDRGILFSAPMVRALLAGRKTQTRRLCAWANNPNSPQLTYIVACDEPGWFGDEEGEAIFRAPHAPGDRLYVREANKLTEEAGSLIRRHVADGTKIQWSNREQACWIEDYQRDYCPGIHMPRWASRLWLGVTDVRVQRLQKITLAEICAEGLASSIYDFKPVQQGFEAWATVWNSLHPGEGSTWEANPWVVATSFVVKHGNIDAAAPHG